MRFVPLVLGVSAVRVCGCASKPCPTASQAGNASASEKASAPAAAPVLTTPLILEKDEGERRVVRPWPEPNRPMG